MFYKRIGSMNLENATKTCSDYGTHLPRPRSRDENDFFRKLFPNAWLDITRHDQDFYEIKSSNGHFYETSAFNPSMNQNSKISPEYFEKALKYNWTYTGEIGSRVAAHFKMDAKGSVGAWISVEDSQSAFESVRDYKSTLSIQVYVYLNDIILNTVCALNVDLDCSKCREGALCRYKDEKRRETECVCPLQTGVQNSYKTLVLFAFLIICWFCIRFYRIPILERRRILRKRCLC